jgi:hypothetical protein
MREEIRKKKTQSMEKGAGQSQKQSYKDENDRKRRSVKNEIIENNIERAQRSKELGEMDRSDGKVHNARKMAG